MAQQVGFTADRRIALFSGNIGAAVTSATVGAAFAGLSGCKYLALEAFFDYAASGTSVTVFVQTRIDTGAARWIDIVHFGFTAASGRKIQTLEAGFVSGMITPTSGAMAANTALNGVLGDEIRAIYKSAGDHGDKQLVVAAIAKK